MGKGKKRSVQIGNDSVTSIQVTIRSSECPNSFENFSLDLYFHMPMEVLLFILSSSIIAELWIFDTNLCPEHKAVVPLQFYT
jgi:hypothetical protein